MGIFSSNENRIKCGSCGTEFDFNQNDNCPLCKFGNGNSPIMTKQKKQVVQQNTINYLEIPQNISLNFGEPLFSLETKSVGSWGMFNSFFPGKAVSRILANMLIEQDVKSIKLQSLIDMTVEVFKANGLSKLRGFPNNPKKDNSVNRLVYHFIKTSHQMGLFDVQPRDKTESSVWDAPWTEITITLTKEGLEFAQLRNQVFDDSEISQVLTAQEKDWLLDYLKKIDEAGYKEYSILQAVFKFIKEGHNGKDDLWKWFETNPSFVDYVKVWSRKSNDSEAFKKQIQNIAPTFAASKIALLREFGVIRNKRNDYTITGSLK